MGSRPAGKTDDDTYYGKSGYYGMSPTATYVLTYSMPLKKLCITGKGAAHATWLSAADVAGAIASGRFDTTRERMSAKELVAAFGDWSPIVRGWAAEELSKRPEAKTVVPQLIAMKQPDGTKIHVTQKNENDALEFLRTRPADKPFCLTLAFFATHAEDGNPLQYLPQPESMKLYQNVTIPVPPNATDESFRRLPPFIAHEKTKAACAGTGASTRRRNTRR